MTDMGRNNEEPLLEVKGLKKYYTDRGDFIDRLFGNQQDVKAVDGVSFELYPGETLGLVGESGCGKSSVGESVLRLTEPTDGNVYFRKQDNSGQDVIDITELSASELRDLRKDVQIIFQNPQSSLNPRLTVNDIISEALELHGLAEGRRDEHIKELLERVGLSASHANRYPHEFSGGQLQRIGIARALAVEPDFIVCDEPVSALDVSVQAQILNLLEDLQEEFGIAYLFIAHDLSVVEHISDRIAIMYLGEIVEMGTPEEIFSDPIHPYAEALLSAVPEPDPDWETDRIVLEGTVPSPLNPPSGCKFHTRCPRVIPPKGYDFTQEEWRSVLTFQSRIREEEETLDRLRDGEGQDFEQAIRDEYDLPTRFSDAEVEATISEIIDTLREDSQTVGDKMEDLFVTPCQVDEPELRSVGSERIACHLFDDQYADEYNLKASYQ